MIFYITLDNGKFREIPVIAEFYVQNDFGTYDFYNIPQIDFAKLTHKGQVPPPVFSIGGENVLCISQTPLAKENQLRVKKATQSAVVKIRAVN